MRYEFSTCPPSGRTSFPAALQVQDETQTVTFFSDSEPCGQGQRVFFVPPLPGRYRIRIASGGAGGEYTLAHRIFRSPWMARLPLPILRGVSRPTTVASGGLLYLIGGGLDFGGYTNQVWAYDPVTNLWSRKADIPASLAAVQSAAALDGRIYVFGGLGGSGALDTTWIYNTATNAWSTGRRLPARRSGAAVAVANGKIIIAGGSDISAETTTWEYDPSTDTFATKAPLPSPQALLRGGTVSNAGRLEVHVFGGTTHLVYDVAGNTWRPAPPIPLSVFGPAVVALSNRFYVMGGSPTFRTQIYDSDAGAWLQGPPIFGDILIPAADAVGNTIFLMGGLDSGGRPLDIHFSWQVE